VAATSSAVVQTAVTRVRALAGNAGTNASVNSTNGAGATTPISGTAIGSVQNAGGNGSTGDFTAGTGFSGAGGGGAGPSAAGGNASGSTGGTTGGGAWGDGGTYSSAGANGTTTDSSTGVAAGNYGGAGSGGKANGAPNQNGGNGGNGIVVMSWTDPAFSYIPPSYPLSTSRARSSALLSVASAQTAFVAGPSFPDYITPCYPLSTSRARSMAHEAVASGQTQVVAGPSVPNQFEPEYPSRVVRRSSVAQLGGQASMDADFPYNVIGVSSTSYPPTTRRRTLPIAVLQPAMVNRVAPPAAVVIDFVLLGPRPTRFPYRATVRPQVTGFEDLNWDLAAVASARYPTWSLVRRKSVAAVPSLAYAERAMGGAPTVDWVLNQFTMPPRLRVRPRATAPAYTERTLAAPPAIDWVLQAPPSRVPARARTHTNRWPSQENFGVEILVPVMSWEGYTTLYPATINRMRSNANRTNFSLVQTVTGPQFPDLSWQPEVADTTRRPALRASAHLVSARAEALAQLPVPALAWEPQYPDRIVRLRSNVNVQGGGAFIRDIVVPLPDLSWEPQYPDRALRRALPVSSVPYSFRGEALGQFQVPALSWKPLYPDTTRRRALRTSILPFYISILDPIITDQTGGHTVVIVGLDVFPLVEAGLDITPGVPAGIIMMPDVSAGLDVYAAMAAGLDVTPDAAAGVDATPSSAAGLDINPDSPAGLSSVR
jgi:hypothetical protein